jgi:hypothetical protein
MACLLNWLLAWFIAQHFLHSDQRLLLRVHFQAFSVATVDLFGTIF